MGTSVTVVAGVALAFRNCGEPRIAITWVGDGATKTAACHEGMNLAAVQDMPAIFVIQNNQVALGTSLARHGAGDLHAWPAMYGIDAWTCDGNNVVDVYAETRLAAERCRGGPGPAAILADTFRMGGHVTHDQREAREALPAEWGKRDPIGLFEAYPTGRGVAGSGVWLTSRPGLPSRWMRPQKGALEARDKAPHLEQALYGAFSEGARSWDSRSAQSEHLETARSILDGQVSRERTLE